jgi:hypothetical protein
MRPGRDRPAPAPDEDFALADQFDTFKKEIEEDLARERAQQFWNRYGTYVVGAALALVLGVATYKLLESRKRSAAEAAATALTAAVQSLEAKSADGLGKLEALTDAPGGYGILAQLRVAAEQARSGARDKAIASYDALARNPNVDRLWSDFAALQAGLLKVDAGDWSDVKNRLNDLASDSGSWRHQAREGLGIAAFKSGDLTQARDVLAKLVAGEGVPRAIVERAQIMLSEIAQAELAKAAPVTTVPPPAPSSPAPAPTKK